MIQHSLSKLVKKEYLKSIIYPLLLIEAMLLGAYFWSNSYVVEPEKLTNITNYSLLSL